MHLDAVRAAGAGVTAVWDPDPAATERFAGTSGVVAAASLAALLDAKPDMVVVMGHPAEVPGMARTVLEAGLPMVLEKPAAPTTELLAAIAPSPGHFVAVPLANRCSPIWAEMDRLRAAGRLGAVAHAQFRIINGAPERYRVDRVGWLLDPAIGGGGAMRNLGLHAVDAALCLFGDTEPVLATAVVRADMHGEAVEDYSLAVLTAPGGPVVTVEAGYSYATMAPGGDYEWRVSAGNAYLVDTGATCRVATLDDGAISEVEPVPSRDRYRVFMADTLDRFRRGVRPLVDFNDYVRAMRVVDAIYARAAS
jgi:predicted dehydrogenase